MSAKQEKLESAWIKLWWLWYTTSSHAGLGCLALNIGGLLMHLAAASPVVPELRKRNGQAWTPLEIANLARVEGSREERAETMRAALQEIVDAGTLLVAEDGSYAFSEESWERFQGNGPSAKRMADHREKKKAEAKAAKEASPARHSDADVTRSSRARSEDPRSEEIRSPPTPPQAGGGEGVEVQGPGRGSRSGAPRPGRRREQLAAPTPVSVSADYVRELAPEDPDAWPELYEELARLRESYDRSLLTRDQVMAVARALHDYAPTDVAVAVTAAIRAKREHWPPTVMLTAWAAEARTAREARERAAAAKEREHPPNPPPSAIELEVISELRAQGRSLLELESEVRRRTAARAGAAAAAGG